MTFAMLFPSRVPAAALSGGGSCGGGSAALSVGPAGGQTAVGPLAQLLLGPCTPWTAGPGPLPAVSPHSVPPAGVRGLRGGDGN